jgi:hypothetical protein
MAITITHTKVSLLADTLDTTLIQPSDWNEEHAFSGLGNSAELDVGTTAGTVAAGDHTHIELEELFMPSTSEAPLTNALGGTLYVEAGALKFLGPTGVVTTLVAAPV